jgi:hypothetical protein
VIARLVDVLRRPRSSTVVHLVILAVGAIVLLVLAGRQWLFYDDWAFIVNRPDQLLAPHVGHWSAIPYLIFVAIRDTFGIDQYRPFAVPVIVAQLFAAHFTWTIMRRVGVAPWIATAFTVITVFFGVGGENVLWAFQIAFIGPIALLLGVIVVLLRARLGTGWIVAIASMSLVAVAMSGTALPLLVPAVLIGWNRHGWRRTLAAFIVPVAVYAAWYVAIGRTAAPAGRAHGVQLLEVPQYALNMLSGGFAGLIPIAVLGTLAFGALVIWWLFGLRRADRVSRPAFLLFLAAPIFALLTGYSRIDLGADLATSSRYLYLVVIVMLPLAALGITRLLTRAPGVLAPAVALVLVVGVFQGLSLGQQLRAREIDSQQTRQALSAAAELIREHPSAFPTTRQVYLKWAPDVEVGDLKEFVERGWFHPTAFTSAARWSELLALSVRVTGVASPGRDASCQLISPGSDVDLGTAGSLDVEVDAPSTAEVSVGGGNPVTVSLRRGWNQVSYLAETGMPALSLTAGSAQLQACGVSR